MRRTLHTVLLAVGVWGLPGAALEYPLQSGLQIIFEATTAAQVAPGQSAAPFAWRYELWVLGEREQGKFEAVWVFYNAPRTPQEMMGGALPLTLGKTGEKQFPREREATYKLQETIESFLPDLSGMSAFDKVWKGPVTVRGQYISYQPLDEANGLVRCSFAQYGEDKMDQVIGVLTTGEAFFDPQSHWLREVQVSTTIQTPQGPQTVPQATARLVKVVQKDATWVSKRREEARAFFTALQQHDDQLFAANDDLAAATLTLSTLSSAWETFLNENSVSIFAPLARSHLLSMQAELPILQTLWRARKTLVGKTSPKWTLKDTAGGQVSLETLGDYPVLILFWSRLSWESLLAMRELGKIREDYGPKGLVILPINLDQNDQEAIESLKVMGLNMTTLRNLDPNLLTAYGVPLGMLPSMVVLDRSKKVVDVRYGWGKRVFQELRRRIEGTL